MSNLPRAPKLGPRFDEAFRYATNKHAEQTRKKTDVPYISHLMSVAALVLEAGGDEDQTIAALPGYGQLSCRRARPAVHRARSYPARGTRR